MNHAIAQRRERAVRRADAKRTAPPAEYWNDEKSMRQSARVRAREEMSEPDYFAIVFELASSDDAARRLGNALNRALYSAERYPGAVGNELVADVAREFMRELRILAAKYEFEGMQR